MIRALLKYLIVIHILLIFIAVNPVWTLEGTEYQIKGAMMINFIKFVQWPEPSSDESPDMTITIGIVGANKFADTLDQIEGKNNRRKTTFYSADPFFKAAFRLPGIVYRSIRFPSLLSNPAGSGRNPRIDYWRR